MILVIGYGKFGRKVVSCINNIEEEITVIDKSSDVFDSIDNLNFNFMVGDSTDEKILIKSNIEKATVVIILTNEPKTNQQIAKLVSKLNPKAYLIVRGLIQYPDLYENIPINKIIYPIDCAAKDILIDIEKSKIMRKINDLKEVVLNVNEKHNSKNENGVIIDGNDTIVNNSSDAPFIIFTHNNPDPDSLASALALKKLMSIWGVESIISYYGKIGYDENKAMVNLLNIKLTHFKNINLNNYSGIAIVDGSSSKQFPIDKNKEVDIIIDHHGDGDLKGKFEDIRENIGSTASIITEYLINLNIKPSDKLATGLYYAICTDTNYFKRMVSTKDFDAAGYLQKLIDPKLLELIENPDMDTESMEILAKAILNRNIIKNNIALSYVGNISNRDALPYAADYLLKMEGINTTFVFGIYNNEIHIIGRTKDLRINLGEIMNAAFGGGGHQPAAAAKIELGIFGTVSDKDSLKNLVVEAIKSKILAVMGIVESNSENNKVNTN